MFDLALLTESQSQLPCDSMMTPSKQTFQKLFKNDGSKSVKVDILSCNYQVYVYVYI